MRPLEIYRWKAFQALVVSSLCLSFVRCGGHGGFLGLEDYQRDVLSVVGGGLAGALLNNMVAELGLPDDRAGQPAPGAPGPQGPPGPTFFSVYIDQFFGAQFEDGFEIVPVPEDAPPEVLERLTSAGVAIARTDHDGAVTVRSNGRAFAWRTEGKVKSNDER